MSRLSDAVARERAKAPTPSTLALAMILPNVVLGVAHSIPGPAFGLPGAGRAILFAVTLLWAARIGGNYARRTATPATAGALCSCRWRVDRVTVEDATRLASAHRCGVIS